MVRGMPVADALEALEHTHKKAARIAETLIRSALANAVHNSKQREEDLVVKTIVVNQAQSYRRGVPMARGRMRPMRKFMSHMEVVLGVKDQDEGAEEGQQKSSKKAEKASQEAKKPVKESKIKKSAGAKKSSSARVSSASSSS